MTDPEAKTEVVETAKRPVKEAEADPVVAFWVGKPWEHVTGWPPRDIRRSELVDPAAFLAEWGLYYRAAPLKGAALAELTAIREASKSTEAASPDEAVNG